MPAWSRKLSIKFWIAAGVVAVIGAFLLGSALTKQPSAPSPQAAPSASADNGGVSVEQFAGQVSAIRQSFNDSYGEWTDSHCSVTAIAFDDVECSIRMSTLGTAASKAEVELRGLVDPESSTYMGLPPDELQPVYQVTHQRAQTAASEARLYDKLTCPEDGSKCTSAARNLETAVEDLRSEFAKWDPYI